MVERDQASAAATCAEQGRASIAGHTASAAALELIERHRALVYGYLVRCGVSEGLRDALFIEVLTQVWDARALLQIQERVDPWLIAIVVHVIRARHREQRVRALVLDEPSHLPGEPSPLPAEVLGRVSPLQAALLELPFEQREIFVLCCIEHVALADAALALDLPLPTAQLHLQAARLALAHTLARARAPSPSVERAR